MSVNNKSLSSRTGALQAKLPVIVDPIAAFLSKMEFANKGCLEPNCADPECSEVATMPMQLDSEYNSDSDASVGSNSEDSEYETEQVRAQ